MKQYCIWIIEFITKYSIFLGNLPTKFKRDHCLSHKIISYTVMDKTSQENDRTNSVITMGNLIICIQCHHFSSVLFVICTTDVSKLYLCEQENQRNFITPWSGRLILATIIFFKDLHQSWYQLMGRSGNNVLFITPWSGRLILAIIIFLRPPSIVVPTHG